MHRNITVLSENRNTELKGTSKSIYLNPGAEQEIHNYFPFPGPQWPRPMPRGRKSFRIPGPICMERCWLNKSKWFVNHLFNKILSWTPTLKLHAIFFKETRHKRRERPQTAENSVYWSPNLQCKFTTFPQNKSYFWI